MRLGVVSNCRNARRSRWVPPTSYSTARLNYLIVEFMRAGRCRIATQPNDRLRVKKLIYLQNLFPPAEVAEPWGCGLRQVLIERRALRFRDACSEYCSDQFRGTEPIR